MLAEKTPKMSAGVVGFFKSSSIASGRPSCVLRYCEQQRLSSA
ncbi:MAG: hypothetical protein RSD64_00005 [Christensenellaceae bacterium]